MIKHNAKKKFIKAYVCQVCGKEANQYSLEIILNQIILKELQSPATFAIKPLGQNNHLESTSLITIKIVYIRSF